MNAFINLQLTHDEAWHLAKKFTYQASRLQSDDADEMSDRDKVLGEITLKLCDILNKKVWDL